MFLYNFYLYYGIILWNVSLPFVMFLIYFSCNIFSVCSMQTSFVLLLIFLWDYSMFYVDCSLWVRYILWQRGQGSELGQPSAWPSLCPVVFSPSQQEVELASHDDKQRRIQHFTFLQLQGQLPAHPCCLLAKMACLYLSSFSSVSSHKVQGCPQSSPSHSNLAVPQG